MSRLIHQDFLLQSDEAVRLYHDYAAAQPIIDYHTHLPPAEIAADRRWENLSQVWLNGDHYKWRQMRANGIAERFCTGDATDREKFDAFAGTLPYLLRNPLYHWCHLELARYFGIDDLLLSAKTAGEVWERSAEVFRNGLSARSLIERSNVLALCTSDDPIDSLEHHVAVAADETFAARMLPTWRPSRVLALDDPHSWNGYLDELAAVADVEIASFDDLVAALTVRRDVFHRAGCRLADHALAAGVFSPASAQEIEAAFDRLRSGAALPAAARDQLTTALLLELGRLYSEKGWTMQLRIGAMRDTNSAMFAALGPDSGYDAMGDRHYAEPLARFLDALHSAGDLPKTILYNVNPRDTEMLASMLACFEDGSVPGKMQLGPAWWFLDQKDGIERQLEAISQIGSLRRFVGMVADSRSFLSFARHEYFRRILCNLLGTDMAAGLLPRDFDLVGALVEDVCFRNAESFFGFELPDRRGDAASPSASALHAPALS
ncbi:MAG TPA: glucuronate isomerase [Thermoanaerobaculia bacterium]|nr:glucuronate isomerase [Thermoanaerobaculia bacterium]